jgi:hypothetical protein
MKKLLILNFFLLTTVLSAIGQHSQTLYYMERLPQVTTMNPAIQPVSNFYLGFPVVSNVNLNVGNNTFSYNDIIFESEEVGSKITFLHPSYNIDDFLGNMNENNDIFTELSTNIFNIGFRADDSYFTLKIQEKSDIRMSYPKDLAEIILKGNEDFKGETAQFGDFSVHSSHYLEYSLGYSQQVTDELTFGINAKYLNGLGLLKSEEFNLGMYTSQEGDSISLTSDVSLKGSSPFKVSTDSAGYIEDAELRELNVSDLTANPGFAIDFGATYELTDNLTLSASIVDLGFINYNNRFAHSYNINGQYSFTGIDVSDEIGENSDPDSDPLESLTDSLEDQIKMEYSEQGFLHFLGPKIYAGARYYVGDRLDFGLLSRTQFYDGRALQSFTLSANTRPFRGFSFTASYSILNNAYNNLGLGIILRLGPFQVYAMSDTFSAGLWPHKTQSFNMRVGLNFAFGNNPKKRLLENEPMIR